MSRALPFRWTGLVMEPVRPRLAALEYDAGRIYSLEEEPRRSVLSERHEFAWLREAWTQLPEELAELYPSPEHLRKRALIQTGYYHEAIIDVGSKAGALRVADALRGIDGFAYVAVRGAFVVRRTAKSQSRRAMKPHEFQESKSKIMELIADMIGVEPGALESEAGKPREAR